MINDKNILLHCLINKQEILDDTTQQIDEKIEKIDYYDSELESLQETKRKIIEAPKTIFKCRIATIILFSIMLLFGFSLNLGMTVLNGTIFTSLAAFFNTVGYLVATKEARKIINSKKLDDINVRIKEFSCYKKNLLKEKDELELVCKLLEHEKSQIMNEINSFRMNADSQKITSYKHEETNNVSKPKTRILEKNKMNN